MRPLVDWIYRLKRAQPPDGLLRNSRRLVVPGLSPLSLDNCIIGIAPIGRLGDRPGGAPESLSVIEWIDDASLALNLKVQEPMVSALGALLTIVADRRIEVVDEIPLRRRSATGTFFR
ncbi:MAG: hypothetical protein ABSG55_10420 [Dehalococcoidia bacterium]|jgi:hypothetical protein